jgi:hypothetical protein
MLSPVDTAITDTVQDYIHIDLWFDKQYHMLYIVYPTTEMIPRRRLIFRKEFYRMVFSYKLRSKRFVLTMAKWVAKLVARLFASFLDSNPDIPHKS